MRGKRTLFGRLARAMGWLLGTLLLVTILPVLALKWCDPVGSAFMLKAKVDAKLMGDEKYRTQYHWVDLAHISPQASLAVIAAEDQHFPTHFGFDFKSIQRALQENENGKRLRGASTITQQVAKNLFLWSGRSFVRKGLEAWFTLLIETLWSKQRILEVYLNIAEFGRGIYGVEAAARHYFGKSALRLQAADAALLAAVLPNPHRLRVNRPSKYVISRQRWILGQMRGLGGASYLRGLHGSASHSSWD